MPAWDANGNLLNDGASQYVYDQANRVRVITQTTNVYNFKYNGNSDRLRQLVNGTPTTYTLDLNTSLVQVLSDGSNAYLYGVNRIAQSNATSTDYFLPDALGSVRQLANSAGSVTLAQWYDPFGNPLSAAGSGTSIYSFAGEQRDNTGLEFLRARYYAPQQGRFTARDVWEGDNNQPMSYNPWLYVYANPVNLTDPSGHIPTSMNPQLISGLNDPLLKIRAILPDVLFCDEPSPAGGLGAPPPQTELSNYIKTKKYGYIDTIHFSTGKIHGASILRHIINGDLEFSEVEAAGGGWLPIQGVEVTYRVRQPMPKEKLLGVALAIFENLEFHFESWQAYYFDVKDSGFSIEDLPSDYLGFFVATRQLAGDKDYMSEGGLSKVLELSGGGSYLPKGQEPPKCNWWEAWNNNQLAECHKIKNLEFTPRVEDTKGKYKNVAWESPFNTIKPVPSTSGLWQEIKCEPFTAYWNQDARAYIFTNKCP